MTPSARMTRRIDRVEIDHFPEKHGCVFLLTQDVAKRGGDLAGT